MQFIELLQTSPFFFHAAFAALGLITGSFLNVVIYRLPGMIKANWREECCEFLEIKNESNADAEPYNLIRPGSRCPQCKHKITALENIPVLSFLFLGGKCSECKNKISPRYPLVEILTALLTVAVSVKFGITIQMFFACLFTWALISLTFIDIDHQLLPDDITLPFLWLGLLCNYFGLFTDIYSSLMGAALGYGILWAIYQLFKLITGKEGMGFGDLKLLAMLGAWAGWQTLATIILVSSLSGALVGVCLILFRRRQRPALERGVNPLSVPISFGPYLALAGWLSLVWGLDLFTYHNALGPAP